MYSNDQCTGTSPGKYFFPSDMCVDLTAFDDEEQQRRSEGEGEGMDPQSVYSTCLTFFR